MRINTNPMSTRTMVFCYFSRARTKIHSRIFSIYSALYCMHKGIIIFTRNLFSCSNLNLLFYEIKINYLFSDRMFYLNSRIHFHKIEIAIFIHKKFYRSNSFILYSFCCFYSCNSHSFAQFICHKRRWRFFH